MREFFGDVYGRDAVPFAQFLLVYGLGRYAPRRLKGGRLELVDGGLREFESGRRCGRAAGGGRGGDCGRQR